ncbi:uncharacterized protein V1510DRAFT_420804 [Dipodascopsis tothii]|uniref:uncharacterized protein n=1 Tax=Dipodascopsis tothii TaxID=44089 RepID=UPI0034CEB7D4
MMRTRLPFRPSDAIPVLSTPFCLGKNLGRNFRQLSVPLAGGNSKPIGGLPALGAISYKYSRPSSNFAGILRSRPFSSCCPQRSSKNPTSTMSALPFGTAASARLAGKTILITGASSGIGRATAKEFTAAAGGDVKLILTARRDNLLATVKEELEKAFPNVKVYVTKLDVRNTAEISSFVSSLPEGFKNVDVLVNNAGMVFGTEQVGDIAQNDIEVMFQTNVYGLIALTQEILPLMKAAGKGDIINIGSIAGREPYMGGAIYCATKAAVKSFTESLRKELVSTRIRVIEVDPGQVETEFSVVRFRGDKSKADAVYAGVQPLIAEDIAEIIVFAVSRRENTVIADTLVFPNHQASALIMHRKL